MVLLSFIIKEKVMKKLLILFLLLPSLACATLTPGKIPVTKQGTGGSQPSLQDSDITDTSGNSVSIGVPVTIQGQSVCLANGTNCSMSGSVTAGTVGREAVYTGTNTVGSGNISDNGSVVNISLPATVQGNSICTAGNSCVGYQGSLALNQGTYVNGGLCVYSSSGSLINCQASSSGIGSVLSVGVASPNSTLQSVGGTNPVTSSGTINEDVNWTTINGLASINTGGVNWSSVNGVATINQGGVNWSTLNRIINSLAVNWTNINLLSPINSGGVNWSTIPSYATGNVLTATTNGGVNWAIAGTGSGTVTSVTGTAPIVSSGGATPAISVNWSSLNGLGDINMGGVNWNNAYTLNQGINWYQVPLIVNSMTTTANAPGYIQLWNTAKTFFFNQSINSGATSSSGINWSAVSQVTGSFPITGDAFGDLNWQDISKIALLVNWSTVPGYSTGNCLGATTNGGINWIACGSGGGSGTVSSGTTNQEAVYTGSTTVGSGNITDIGNIGIGTLLPRGNLGIEASSGFDLSVIDTQSGSQGAVVSMANDPGAALVSGNRIGGFGYTGAWDSSHDVYKSAAAAVYAYADGTWSSSAEPAHLEFATTTGNTRTTALYIDSGGNIGIGTLKPTSGALQIGTDASQITVGTALCVGTGNCVGTATGTLTGTTWSGCTCMPK